MKTWVRGATHCAEYATEDGTLDEEKADECRSEIIIFILIVR